jgi:hypothetical protein
MNAGALWVNVVGERGRKLDDAGRPQECQSPESGLGLPVVEVLIGALISMRRSVNLGLNSFSLEIRYPIGDEAATVPLASSISKFYMPFLSNLRRKGDPSPG